MLNAMLMASDAAFTINGPLVVASWEMFGMTWNLTESVIVQWIVIAVLAVLFIALGTGLKVVPTTRRQALAEWLVTFVIDMVDGSMGQKYKSYRPYVGMLIIYVVVCNLIGLLGLRSPTADVSVTATLAIITFFMTQYNRAKSGGVKGYFKSFIEPLPFMLPSNIIGEISNPVSMALRLFGNMVAGMVIGGLIYWALGSIMPPIFIPAVASLYFDIFSGVIQAYIFTMLTMSYIANAECE